MFHDLKTVIRKELREILAHSSGFKGGKTGLLIFLGVFGILMPLQNGAAWLKSPLAMLYWAWVPILLASSVVADSFAGERERHTLETLLASRLPDRAILAGKILAAVIYAWGFTLVCIFVGAVVINIVHGKGHLIFYAAPVAAGIVLITFLVSLLASGLGVLISLRASTVRQAQQIFSIAFLVFMVPLFMFPMLPAGAKAKVMAFLSHMNLTTMEIGALTILFVANIAILAVADARFKRNRLILD